MRKTHRRTKRGTKKRIAREILPLILILASIGVISIAFVEIPQFQPIVRPIEEHSSFLLVVASYALVIVTAFGIVASRVHYLLRSGRRRALYSSMIEEYLEYLQILKVEEKEKDSCREFSPTDNYSSLLDSVLEKMKRKEEWDSEVDELNRSCEEFRSKLNKLKEGRLKELIERHKEEIREKYEANEEMREYQSPFQDFLKKLIDEFYKCHMRKRENQGIWDLSWYYLDDLFDRIRDELIQELEEIDGAREEWERHIDKLISLLEEAREYLRKEYKLTPSEQSLQITLNYQL
jgi:hypothetical protein